ncbi:MAG: hypothetical protein ABR991_06005 [Terracidiphilus sp.]|jgi:hypothetical protein
MHIPRGWTTADAVAATREFFAQPPPRRAAIRDLMNEVLSPDRYMRRCAADVARLVSAREPEILRAYVPVLIDLLTELHQDEWQARGYLTLAAVLNASTHAQRMQLAIFVRALVNDPRNALRAIALEAFAILAAHEPELREEAMPLLERSRREGTCAMRCRAKRMLPLLLAAEIDSRPNRARASG